MRQMTCGWDILLKSGLLLAMILKRLLAEGIGIINDALSRIPLFTIQFQLSCSTNSLVPTRHSAGVIGSLKSCQTIGSKCWECAAYALCVRVEFLGNWLAPNHPRLRFGCVGVTPCRQTSHGHDGNRRNAGRDVIANLRDSTTYYVGVLRPIASSAQPLACAGESSTAIGM